MTVTWVALSWVALAVELAFALWAWRYSTAPLAAALIVTAGIAYYDLPSVALNTLGFVALFLVPVPFVGHVLSLRRRIIASDADPLERRDDDRHDGARAIDDLFDQHTLAMRVLGFRRAGDFVETAIRDDDATLTFTRVFNGSDLRERAALEAIVTRRNGQDRISRPTLRLVSRREDGRRIVTTNARVGVPFRSDYVEDLAAVPSVKTAADLLEVHRARLAHMGEMAARQPTPHDWLEEHLAMRRETFRAMLDARICKRTADEEYWLTWRGALRLAVADCPVLRPFLFFPKRWKEARFLAALREPLPVVESAEELDVSLVRRQRLAQQRRSVG